jgi:predicted RNA-binding Zn ribbon-like protein
VQAVPPITTVPDHAVLLRDFVNTIDVEAGTDTLATPAGAARWLREHELLDDRTPVTASELETVLRLRTGLRTAMTAHHDADAESTSPELDALAARLPLRLSFAAGQPRLTPAADGVPGALGALLVAVSDATADGSWERLKLCPADDCAWGFYDTSKNRSRTWCAMGVCGNRQKTRTYRARQRTAG